MIAELSSDAIWLLFVAMGIFVGYCVGWARGTHIAQAESVAMFDKGVTAGYCRGFDRGLIFDRVSVSPVDPEGKETKE